MRAKSRSTSYGQKRALETKEDRLTIWAPYFLKRVLGRITPFRSSGSRTPGCSNMVFVLNGILTVPAASKLHPQDHRQGSRRNEPLERQPDSQLNLPHRQRRGEPQRLAGRKRRRTVHLKCREALSAGRNRETEARAHFVVHTGVIGAVEKIEAFRQ